MDSLKTGQFIRKKRLENKYTQKELADRLELDQGTISRFERGIETPSFSTIKDMANIFDVKPLDILEPQADDVLLLGYNGENIEELDSETTLDKTLDILNKNSDRKKPFTILDLFKRRNFNKMISEMSGFPYERRFTINFLFKDLFRIRHMKDYEDTLTQGMFKDNPAHKVIGFKAPWLYFRVFLFMMLLFEIGIGASFLANTPTFALLFGAPVVAIPFLIFIFESNYPRKMSIFDVILMFSAGGLLSILITVLSMPIYKNIGSYNQYIIIAAPLTEELAKQP